MKHIIQGALVGAALLLGQLAQAGTQALGFEIGVSTIDQVQGTLAKQTEVKEIGNNKYSNGPMLQTDGKSYEIESLSEVTYTFDPQHKLAGILMTLGKDRFDSVFKALSDKYKVAEQKRPFVGDQFARFNTQDATIQVSAPHLSFDMTVSYLRHDLLQKFKTQSATEAESKKKREAAKF